MTATAKHGKKTDHRRLLLVAAAAIVGLVIIRRLRARSAAAGTVATVADPSTLPTDATIAGGNTDPNVIQALDGFGARLDTFQGEIDALTTTPQAPGVDPPSPAAPPPASAPLPAPEPLPTPQPVVVAPAAPAQPVIVHAATILAPPTAGVITVDGPLSSSTPTRVPIVPGATRTVLVDNTAHVVNAKGARVGGKTAEL